MTLFHRFLHRLPVVQQLEAERNALRAEQSSMQLKVRAASAKMAVLEEQCRVAQSDRDRLVEQLARRTAEHRAEAARLEAALVEATALVTDRNKGEQGSATDGNSAAGSVRTPDGARQTEGSQ